MTLLTDENIFGKFVPKPTISKITLQSSGNPPRRLNPHVDSTRMISRAYRNPRTGEVEVRRRTTASERQVLGTVEGSDNLLRATSQTQSSHVSRTDNLRVLLNLSVKDKIRDLQNSWFANVSPMFQDADTSDGVDEFDLKNYVTIKVFQSRTQLTSNTILSADDSIAAIKRLDSALLNIDLQERPLSQIQDPNDVMEENDTSQAIGGPSNLKYWDVPFSMTFEVDEKYPDYLCYFVWAEFDLSDIASQFEFDVAGFSSTALFQGMDFSSQLSHYVVLSGGKLATRNTLIQDFRAVDRLNKLNLDFSIVQNSLKGNLSLASKMRTANLSLDPPNKYFTDIMLTRDEDENCRFFFSADIAAIMEANSPFGNLFSEGSLTKEACVGVTKVLSLSVHRVRLKGSPEIGSKPIFGPKIFGNRQAKRFNENNEFLTSFPSSTGSPNSIPSSYTTENDDLLLRASYDEAGTLSLISLDGASTIADLTSDIYQGEAPKAGIKYFSGVDRTVQFKTDGYYQYRLVIEFQDGAVNYLINKLNQLRTAKNNLTEYYDEASKLGTSQLKNPFKNPHAFDPAVPQVPYSRPEGGVRPGNFNVAANRFTQEFKSFARTKKTSSTGGFTPPWHSTLPANPPWHSVAVTYVRIMEELSGFGAFFVTRNIKSPGDRINWRGDAEAEALGRKEDMLNAIENYMSPETGNIEGILKVFSLIDTLEDIISSAIGRVTSPPGGSARLIKNQSANNNPKLFLSGKTVLPMPETKDTTLKSVKIDHTFGNIFNAGLPKDTGISMFPDRSLRRAAGLSTSSRRDTSFEDANGLRTLPWGHFQSNVSNELKKIFEYGDQNRIDIQPNPFGDEPVAVFPLGNTSNTYFTPSIIKTSSAIINLNPGDNANSGVASTWPTQDEWGRVGIADDMLGDATSEANPNPNAISSRQATQRETARHILSDKVASFMAQDHNLIALEMNSVTNKPKESRPIVSFDAPIGPGDVQAGAQPQTDSMLLGRNRSYKAKKQEATAKNSLAYSLFSLITDALKTKEVKNMNLYKPKESAGYINKAGNNRDEFAQLPNAIKVLFAGSFERGGTSQGSVTQTLTNHVQQLLAEGGFNGTNEVKMAMKYLFETIYVLEVFTGWQDGKMIERWEPLTTDVADRVEPQGGATHGGSGPQLLCRFRRYENAKYGVMGNNGSSLPIYDQYFILKRGAM